MDSNIFSNLLKTLSVKITVRFIWLLALVAFIAPSCIVNKTKTVGKKDAISALRFIGEYSIPHNMQFNNSTVGGLSGIDYDPVTKRFYFISDDRSALQPARFYTAQMKISPKGIDSFYFTSVNFLSRPDGTVYPAFKTDHYNTTDPESIRYFRSQNQLIWSSEGERIVHKKDTVLTDPTVHFMALDGSWKDSLVLPVNLHMNATQQGPRQNGVLEGIAFDEENSKLYLSVEEPLLADGPVAEIYDNDAFVRILEYNMQTKSNSSQYAYKLDPVAQPPNPPTAYKVNGISEILGIGHRKLLVVERSYSTGKLQCTIKIFVADFNKASDISENISLQQHPGFIAAEKKLVLNMDDLGIYIDNIEGVTFGPLLPNGNKTLLFVSDNNFSSFQKTQLLLFEIK